ncbi:interleukin-13 receptor subunit alpha-2-like isoform X1 [Petromyzon marinus]|uniref:interleukin-13 receptor subunit alpha-2-like isoform X1 n=2 Tax=Petromyzon marinus TaxID=7757 RepID=UPI003F709362
MGAPGRIPPRGPIDAFKANRRRMKAVPPGLLLLLTLTLCASTGPTHAERMRAPSGLRVVAPEYPMQLRLRWDPPGNASEPEGDRGLVQYALQIFDYSAGRRKELQCILTPLTNYTNSQFSHADARARVSVVSWHADACTNSSQRYSNWSELVDISSPRGLVGSAASGVRCALLTGAAETMECTWTRGPNASADTEYSLYYWHSTLNATRRCVPCTHERLTADAAKELCHHSGRGAGHGKKAATKQRKTRAGIPSGTWSTTRGAAGAADSAAGAEATGRTAGAAGAAGPGAGGAALVTQRCCVPLADVPEYRSFRILINGTSAHHNVTPFYCPLPVESLVKPDPPSELHAHLNGSSLLVKWDPLPGYQRHQSTCYQTDMRIHSGPQDHQEVSEPRASWPQPETQGCHAVTFRVRARPGRCTVHGVRGLWSEWSPEARYIPSPAPLCADAHGDGNATGHRTRVTEYPDPSGALGSQEPQRLAWFLASGLVALSIVVLAVVFVYKSQRLRRCLVPWVPDPSRYFKSLFDDHNGDFQAWAGFQASGKPAAPPAAAGDEAEEGSPVPLCVLSEMAAFNGGGGVGGVGGYLNLETVGTETALLWQHG